MVACLGFCLASGLSAFTSTLGVDNSFMTNITEILSMLENNGYVRSPADHRDWQYAPLGLLVPALLPAEWEVDRYNPLPVYDQGDYPACVGWMLAQMKTVHERKDKRRTLAFDGKAFYDKIALPGGGAYLRDAFQLAVTQGVPTVTLTDQPGKLFKIASYSAINPRNHTAVKHAIKTNRGLCIGFGVTLNWMSDGGREFTVPRGTDPNEVVGGHGAYISGYKRTGPVCLNSWGRSWSGDGRQVIDWDYWDKNVWECWTVQDVDD
jgi:hypothetical protein